MTKEEGEGDGWMTTRPRWTELCGRRKEGGQGPNWTRIVSRMAAVAGGSAAAEDAADCGCWGVRVEQDVRVPAYHVLDNFNGGKMT